MSLSSPAERHTTPPLGGLVDRLRLQTDFATWLEQLLPGKCAGIGGVWGSNCALLAAAITSSTRRRLLIVCDQSTTMDQLVDAWPLFGEMACGRFPAWDTHLKDRVVYDDIFADRIQILKSLTAKEDSLCPQVIVTSIASLLQKVPSQQELQTSTRHIQLAQQIDLEQWAAWMDEAGMHPTSSVELPGEFALRGGLLDIFAADHLQPYRIETFGDEVASIRQFDIETQRSLQNVETVEVTALLPRADQTASLIDYLQGTATVLLVEPDGLKVAASDYLSRVEGPENHFSYPQLLQQMVEVPLITAETIATSTGSLNLPMQSVERFTGDIVRVKAQLDQWAEEANIDLICPTEAECERIGEIFADCVAQTQQRLRIIRGRLHEGFRWSSDRTGSHPEQIVIGSEQLFQREDVRRTARRRLGRAIDSFTDLRPGDLVVHLAHGIGRYLGLETISREHQREEHLKIEFDGGTKIFVPTSRIALVQKYVGGTRGRPRLAKIGGSRWLRQKEAAENAVSDMAVEMLEMQAARKTRQGISFPSDSHWQQEFDAAFPYEETPDQLAALSAIKDDMSNSRPMDRLLCGDVGFGKTELALRAAFKAVDSGYQVAVLVPTTILAAQHLDTFRNRMAEFPIEIASLSRFSTRKEQTKTLKRMASGEVDIAIGTHRLAQRDVQFQNLGLVVIDEEQRFGVEIKERLKAVRQTVDVMTLTATPIPRTLHLSLLGARDISNLETPPEDRLAVETRVVRFDPDLIRRAVDRELNRNGQVYFVHNRVHDIQAVADKLREIVPDASLVVGHGQMPEGQLEQVMVEFIAGKFDILVATTIVESGLDIPNANTIFIDDADRYGLADLHQLRGRVGRAGNRAYCYLLLDPRKHLSPTSSRRLRAIEEFSEMGAGFQIAMRDLEIRGAGNILGTQQSGHIAAVGYELYCQLLEQAVGRLQRQPPRQLCDVDIDLPGEAILPDQYVPDLKSKIDLYRRLVRITTTEDLEDIREEMIDRFGSPPITASRLLDLAVLRILAACWAVYAIRMENRSIVLHYRDASRMQQLKKQAELPVRIVDASTAYIPLPPTASTAEAVFNEVKSLLQTEQLPL
ncbi:MAG: transcription-repair coupling factor [Planctomycetota bacterium]|nr:transcription-repair coupling factor [Planctomycetota bacterium]